MPERLLPNEAWRLGSPESLIIMHRWACTDGRYSWGLRGPCPLCGEHDVDVFFVGPESDPDAVQPRLCADADDACFEHFRIHRAKETVYAHDQWRRFIRARRRAASRAAGIDRVADEPVCR
jgi:hypothetical protein